MLYQTHFLYRLKLVLIYLIVKLEFLHSLLPKNFRNELPRGWNNQMFWVAFQSGGTRLYFDCHCKLKEPESYEPKVVVDDEYKLTEEEIRSFYENGYMGPFELMPPEEIEGIRQHLLKLAETESKILSFSRGDYKFWSSGNGNGNGKCFDDLSEKEKKYVDLVNTSQRHLEDSLVLNLFKHPAVTERCAQILGSDLFIWHSNYFGVNPHSKGTPWHQESKFFSYDMKEPVLEAKNEEEVFELSCWIALTDTPKERACLAVIPGSQKEIYPVRLKAKRDRVGDGGRIYGKYDGEIDYPINSQDIKFIPAKAGQFYLFCERTAHGSSDNTTNEKRWALGGRIIKADTKVFTKTMLENGLNFEIYGMKIMNLDNWKPVRIRG